MVGGMEDYPRTLMDFEQRFASDEACRDYLFRLRWPDGFVCARCQNRAAWSSNRHLSVCTAWSWLHKLRRAMVRPGRDRLSGRIEVDETYLGAPEPGTRGRGIRRKTLIGVAAQEDGKGIGRIRLRRLRDASAVSLHAFVQEAIEPGSLVHTDGWEGYSGVEAKGYRHEVTLVSGGQESPSELLPRVHRVVSLLKRWLMGTHQGAVSHEHLDYYLDEFTFRFNRRSSQHRGKLFYRLAQQAVAVQPTPYRAMIRNVRGLKRQRSHI